MIYVLFNHCDWDANKKYSSWKSWQDLKKVVPSYICLISVFIRFFLLSTILLLRLAREGLAKGPWQIFTNLCGTSVAQKLPCVSKYGLQNTTSRADIGVCTVISVGFSGNAGWPPGYEKNIQIGGVLFGLFWVDSPPPFTMRLSILLQVFPHVLLHVQDQLQKKW